MGKQRLKRANPEILSRPVGLISVWRLEAGHVANCLQGLVSVLTSLILFFFQAEDGIRDYKVTGVQTCALPIFRGAPGVMKEVRALGARTSFMTPGAPRRRAGHARPAVWTSGRSWRSKLMATSRGRKSVG